LACGKATLPEFNLCPYCGEALIKEQKTGWGLYLLSPSTWLRLYLSVLISVKALKLVNLEDLSLEKDGEKKG
jgi:hypothetical protein